jgi:BCCT family betaine/carnitine transporter
MKETDISTNTANRPEMRILVPATIVLLLVTIPSIAFPEFSEKFLKIVYGAFSKYTGTYYLWVTLGMIVLSVYFACSRIGDIKFGEPDEKPEFSTFAWISMLFCSGVAGAVMFWSIIEPLYNLIWPPRLLDPMSVEAYEWSMTYLLFHWGPVTWPWYILPSLPICYMLYKRKKPVLRMTATCENVLGEKNVNGFWGYFIEVFIIVGVFLGNATILGVCIPIVAHAVSSVLNVEPSLTMQIFILLVSTAIFTVSCYLGLKKGIKRLSTINLVIALLTVAFVVIVGPTCFMVDTFTSSFGKMLNNLPEMLLWTDSFTDGTFPQDWTIFYTLYMASWGPFMGLFIARISRGRTVRQILVWGILGGSAGAYLLHGSFGGYSLYVSLNDVLNSTQMLKAQGGSATMVAVLKTLPFSTVVLFGYCLFSTIFLATSLDSTSYIVASMATQKLNPGEDPSRGHRLFWALLQGALGIAVISMGGLGTVKIFGNFAGALMLIPILILIIAWFKMLKEEKIFGN